MIKGCDSHIDEMYVYENFTMTEYDSLSEDLCQEKYGISKQEYKKYISYKVSDMVYGVTNGPFVPFTYEIEISEEQFYDQYGISVDEYYKLQNDFDQKREELAQEVNDSLNKTHFLEQLENDEDDPENIMWHNINT